MKKKSIALNAILNGFRSILNVIFPLITFPYVSRVLSVESIGKYNFSSTYVSYFVLIAELGVGTYAVREGAKYRNKPKILNQFVDEVFTINVLATIMSYFLLFSSLIIFANLRTYLSCILVFSIQTIFTTLGTEWIYNIFEDYAYITFRSIAFQILSVILLFLCVRQKSDFLIYAAITVLSTVGSNIINFFYARKFCKVKLVWHFNFKKHIIPILIIFASNIAITIYINSDITLLGLMKNNYIVGIYSVSSKIYSIVKSLFSAILVVTIPRLSMFYGQKKYSQYKSLLSDVINSLIIFIVPAMIGLFMLSKNVILIISGPDFVRSTNSLRILSFALIFALIGAFLSGCVLIPIKREKKVLISTIISAILNVVLNIILIPFWDENAAALSTAMAEAMIMILNLYYAKDVVKNIFISKKFVKSIVDSLLGSIGIIFVCFLTLNGYHSILIQTFVSVILSVVIYMAILFLRKNEFIMLLLKNLAQRFNS